MQQCTGVCKQKKILMKSTSIRSPCLCIAHEMKVGVFLLLWKKIMRNIVYKKLRKVTNNYLKRIKKYTQNKLTSPAGLGNQNFTRMNKIMLLVQSATVEMYI